MAAARKPAPRRSKPRARARRSGLAALRLPAIEQRHLDLTGLALVALGVFLAFPLYLRWDGGPVGAAVLDGLAYAVGQVAYGVPVAVVAAGAILVLRPVLPAVRPFRAGALCLFAALTLALAAGTLGLGPDGERPGWWNAPFFEQRGGIVGDALFYASSKAVSAIGAHIIALFLFVAGVLLLTGASIAGVLRATGSGVWDTTRALRGVIPARPRRAPAPPEPAAPDRLVPPDVPPLDAGDEHAEPEPEIVIRATHVEAPSLDGARRYPDLFGCARRGRSPSPPRPGSSRRSRRTTFRRPCPSPSPTPTTR